MPTHARTRTSTTVAVLVLTAVFAAAGCAGGPTPTLASAGSASNSISATPSTPAPAPTPATIGKPYIEKAARGKYSKAQLESAWKYVSQFTAKYSYNPALMDTSPAQVTKKLMEPIRAQMTRAAQSDFDKGVAAVAHGKNDDSGLLGLALVGMNDEESTVASPAVTDLHIDGSLELDDDGETLAPKLNQRAVLHLIDSKHEAIKTTISKTTTLWLKPKGNGWVIDGWQTHWNSSDLVADS